MYVENISDYKLLIRDQSYYSYPHQPAGTCDIPPSSGTKMCCNSRPPPTNPRSPVGREYIFQHNTYIYIYIYKIGGTVQKLNIKGIIHTGTS